MQRVAILMATAILVVRAELNVVEFDHNGVKHRVVTDDVDELSDAASSVMSRSKRQASSGGETAAAAAAATTSASIFECYQYTWPGVTENNTVPNFSRDKKYAPMFPPWVFTNDTTVPDPAVVKEYCRLRGCKVTCPKTSVNSCIRYAYYTNGQPKNITYFCGAVQDTTDNKGLTSGEAWDNIGGDQRRVTFCQSDLCNGGNGMPRSFLVILLSLVLAVFGQ